MLSSTPDHERIEVRSRALNCFLACAHIGAEQKRDDVIMTGLAAVADALNPDRNITHKEKGKGKENKKPVSKNRLWSAVSDVINTWISSVVLSGCGRAAAYRYIIYSFEHLVIVVEDGILSLVSKSHHTSQ